MSKFKDQFNAMRNNMPKGVMWLLLATAFIVVIILLTLIFTGSDKEESEEIVIQPTEAIQLKVNPGDIDFSDTDIREKKKEQIKVLATSPVKITSVRFDDAVPGLSVLGETCTRISVGPEFPCTITVEYKPKSENDNVENLLRIDWYGANETADMSKQSLISVLAGAVDNTPVVVPEPEPVTISEPVPEPVQVQQVIEDIAPSMPMFDPIPETQSSISESCSDFAIAGYDNSGKQIGWIKPQAGSYYFHPFSDKQCKNPTGVYNPDNGIITDINGSGKKIGTDAEHIGFSPIKSGVIPQLNSPVRNQTQSAYTKPTSRGMGNLKDTFTSGGNPGMFMQPKQVEDVVVGTSAVDITDSTQPYDRTFILRQFKPIPATIVSEVRADQSLYTDGNSLPVRATVDRNVYSDNGRTIILPAGTLLLGYVTGEIPGPYKTVGRMQIKWYQFIRPDGVEFNFKQGEDPYSADAQGRSGVPGYGSTDYIEQIVMPLLTAIVPAAVNLISPIADTFVNQIDLDNNTVVQSGTVRSSELAKNEIITAWNQVAQKLLVDALDNTVPPFSIAAGTRITVYSPTDLRVVCMDENKKCYVKEDQAPQTGNTNRGYTSNMGEPKPSADKETWVGQVRSFQVDNCCITDTNDPSGITKTVNPSWQNLDACKDYDYRTLLFSCQANQYQAINNAKYQALWANQQDPNNKNSIASVTTPQTYNEQVLGLKYNADGSIQNPFNNNTSSSTSSATTTQSAPVITCEDGSAPDSYGCCTGEIYTDMGEQGFNCCPASGGDCFPPIK